MDALQHRIGLIKRDRLTTLFLMLGLILFNIYSWENMSLEQAVASSIIFGVAMIWVKNQSKRLQELESLKFTGAK